ncbi:universal stress protein [Kocuria rhizosphaericola]|uniref:universal stress protein n=1 Tax=Kocuria rhizosphaericola TaxID=3376284 RepID=UPI00379207BD
MSDTPTKTPTGDRIIVGVDGSDSSKEALREGARLAQALDAPLEAISCWHDPILYAATNRTIPELKPEAFRADSQRMLENTLEEVFGQDRPVQLSTRLLHGRPAELLVEESKNARMLVLGRRGVGGVLGMVLGSVSSALVAHAHCPVLIVRR